MAHTDQSLELSNEDRLLLSCARTNVENKEDEIRYLIEHEINWVHLLKRSSKHRLNSLLYRQLNCVCRESVPFEVLERLKTDFYNNARKNLMFMGELQKILKLLKSEGITVIPYKGPFLAIQAYKNLALREFDDLDIFIHQEDFLKTKELLISNGYNPDFQIDKKRENKYIESQRERKFIKKSLKISIDVQWKVSALFFSLPKIQEYIGKKTISETINQLEITTFTTEDLVLILCLHNAGHRWERLAWLCDIAELIKKSPVNWGKTIEKANYLEIKKILLINLNLIRDLLDIELPSEIVDEIESNKNIKEISGKIKYKIFSDSSKKLKDEIYFNLILRDNLYYGIKDGIRDAMLPTPLEWKKLDVPLIFYPFYYIFRPFSLIFRYKF